MRPIASHCGCMLPWAWAIAQQCFDRFFEPRALPPQLLHRLGRWAVVGHPLRNKLNKELVEPLTACAKCCGQPYLQIPAVVSCNAHVAHVYGWLGGGLFDRNAGSGSSIRASSGCPVFLKRMGLSTTLRRASPAPPARDEALLTSYWQFAGGLGVHRISQVILMVRSMLSVVLACVGDTICALDFRPTKLYWRPQYRYQQTRCGRGSWRVGRSARMWTLRCHNLYALVMVQVSLVVYQ